MDGVKKYRNELVGVLVLGLVYLGITLPRLGLIPMFTDEAIYLRWSQIMAYDASLRYMPLVDGKPPLFMWFTSVAMRLLPTLDPLLAGRLVAVFAGFVGIVGIYWTAHILFRNRWIAFISGLLYILIPFTFFYDRFGLADALLTALGVWALGLSVLLVQSLRLDVAMILGWVLGFALLTKTPAEFYYGFIPLAVILWDWKNWKQAAAKLWRLGFLSLLVLGISQLIFSVLRLFPLFYMIAQKNSEFIVTPREFLTHPLAHLASNTTTFLTWEGQYLTWPLAVFAVYALIVPFWRSNPKRIYLVLVAAAEFILMAVFNSTIFPRYLLILTPIIYLLLAASAFDLRENLTLKHNLLPAALALFLVLPLFTDYKLLTDPPSAPIAEGDSNQYINAWPAGYGVREVHDFLRDKAKDGKVFVGTEGTFGLMPYALEIYQKDYPNLIIKSYWPLPDKVPSELLTAASGYPVYFIMYQRQDAPSEWRLELLASFFQGRGSDKLRIYRIVPQR